MGRIHYCPLLGRAFANLFLKALDHLAQRIPHEVEAAGEVRYLVANAFINGNAKVDVVKSIGLGGENLDGTGQVFREDD